jgi:hypothetical protein
VISASIRIKQIGNDIDTVSAKNVTFYFGTSGDITLVPLARPLNPHPRDTLKIIAQYLDVLLMMLPEMVSFRTHSVVEHLLPD